MPTTNSKRPTTELQASDQRPNSGDRQQKRSFWIQAGRLSQIAVVLPAATVLGWLLGSALDRWLHTDWLQIVGLILGIVAGFVDLIRSATASMKS